jgi:hypothetical protein
MMEQKEEYSAVWYYYNISDSDLKFSLPSFVETALTGIPSIHRGLVPGPPYG